MPDRIVIIDTSEKGDLMPVPSALRDQAWSMIWQSLETGDFTVDGFEDALRIERKTLPDLMACLTAKDRIPAFISRLDRLSKFKARCLLIEACPSDVLGWEVPKKKCDQADSYEQRGTRERNLLQLERACARHRIPVRWFGRRSKKTADQFAALLAWLLTLAQDDLETPHAS